MEIIKSKCKNCIIKDTCIKFHKIYSNVIDSTNKYIENEKIKLSTSYDGRLMQSKEIMLEQNRKNYIKQLLDKFDNECYYEIKLIEETYNFLDKKFKFEKNPEFNIYLEQILMLKINAFKLNLGHNKYGMIREITDNGKIFPVLTPGIHYSIEFADKITSIINKMDETLKSKEVGNTTNNILVLDMQSMIKKELDEYDRKNLPYPFENE